MPSKSKAKSTTSKSQTNGAKLQAPAEASKANEPAKSPIALRRADNAPPENQQRQASTYVQKQSALPPMLQTEAQDTAAAPGVNRKKQKRRMKEAAKRVATGSSSADPAIEGGPPHTNGFNYNTPYDSSDPYGPNVGDDAYYTNDGRPNPTNYGYPNHNYMVQEPSSAGKRKNKKRPASGQAPSYSAGGPMTTSPHSHLMRPPPPPPPPLSQAHSTAMVHSVRNDSRDEIWNTSIAQERERIKEFWLRLGESERRGLVRIEKEAVLKKMKEQQKHSCSCTVCGRKRTAIEEELEVLYDAYYEELETYANHQHFGLDASALPRPRSYGRPRSAIMPGQHADMRGGGTRRVEELDEEDEEAYSDVDEDDELSDDGLDPPMGDDGGIFNFGNSLTAKGGILTVADDLLKNDGKKFIEMMEQLAERRMQREEESRMLASGVGHPSMRHGPPEAEDDGYDDEEDDEDYNSEEEDGFDGDDDVEALSEEQRMEEGRRMFQIFAARMFEQRVFNAYRQQVAEERQRKLIEELAEDEQLDAQRDAKRAKEAQKKKDKRQKQKQAKDEEKAKKDAEKAAEEAAIRAIEQEKAEEQRQRKEEQRKKKEAEKRAAEDERKRREEEKQRQIRERKEQQAELDRKQREQKERERKKRDEAKNKEREEREAREKEKRERDAAMHKERDAQNKLETAANNRIKHDQLLVKEAVTIPKQRSSASVAAISTQASLQSGLTPSAHASPRLPVATPVVPKPPTPGRVRQRSVQDSRTASPRPSQPASSSTASPAASSELNNIAISAHSRKASQTAPKQPSTQPTRFSPINPPPGLSSQPPGFSVPMPLTTNGYPSTFASPVSPMSHNIPMYHPPGFYNQPAMGGGQYRNPGIPYPPGINSSRHLSHGPLGTIGSQPAQGPEGGQFNTQSSLSGRFSTSNDSGAPHSHSRNQSTSSNASPRDPPSQRPAPIQRPSSVAPQQQKENIRPSSKDVDDLSSQLGSSALLDDTDDTPDSAIEDLRRGSVAVGGPRNPRQGRFGSAPGFAPIGSNARTETGQQPANKMWTHSQSTFGVPGRTTQPFSPAPGFGRPANGTAFVSMQGSSGLAQSRGSRIRSLVCRACGEMSHYEPMSQGWHLVDRVVGKVQSMLSRNEPPVQFIEVLQACDEKSNAQNGAGLLDFRGENTRFEIKYLPDGSMNGRTGSLTDGLGGLNQGGARNLPPIGGQGSFEQQPGGFPAAPGL